jgi:hypothetical protein
MQPLVLGLLLALAAYSADLCPHSQDAGEAQSWAGKSGRRYCVGNAIRGTGKAEWPAAGIVQAEVAGTLEMAVCCFSSEEARSAVLHLEARKLTVATHQEGADGGDEDDFPDLIEDDAHRKAISIRGTLGDPAHPVRVDLLLRCSASKFADQYAFQFVVINRSDQGVEVSWDHLREMQAHLAPSVQPVAGGKAYIFLTHTKPREATATVEVKSPSGVILARFRFDGFTLSS